MEIIVHCEQSYIFIQTFVIKTSVYKLCIAKACKKKKKKIESDVVAVYWAGNIQGSYSQCVLLSVVTMGVSVWNSRAGSSDERSSGCLGFCAAMWRKGLVSE